MTEVPGAGPESEPLLHHRSETVAESAPCEECAQLVRRQVLLGIGLGLVLGAAAVFILTR